MPYIIGIWTAEARDHANREKYNRSSNNKPASKTVSKSSTNPIVSSGQGRPITKEARIAIQQAKMDEQLHSAQLGYNPYETARMSAGQAKTATVNKTHETIIDHDES